MGMSKVTPQQMSRLSGPKRIALGAAALFLVWEVITHSLVASLATASPRVALALRSNASAALLNRAENDLKPYAKSREPGTESSPGAESLGSSKSTEDVDQEPASSVGEDAGSEEATPDESELQDPEAGAQGSATSSPDDSVGYPTSPHKAAAEPPVSERSGNLAEETSKNQPDEVPSHPSSAEQPPRPDEPPEQVERESHQGDPQANDSAAPEADQTGDAAVEQPSVPRPVAESKPLVDEEIGKSVRRALEAEPMNARGFRILGQIAYLQADDATAAKFMQSAARLSRRQVAAVYWIMRKAYEQADYKAAASWADALLRVRPQMAKIVTGTLGQMAENAEANAEVKKVIAEDPPWRRAFLYYLLNNIKDARTPLDLMLALKSTAHPASAKDVEPYLRFLVAHKFYDLAYASWLQLLPVDQGALAQLLFNGSFELPLSGMPFDWDLASGSGASVDILPRPDQPDHKTLHIELENGRVDFKGVKQLTTFSPGFYRFKGSMMGQVSGRRGLRWRVTCVDRSNKVAGESTMFLGAKPDWTAFEFPFVIPESDCPAQYVRLDLDARSASERLVSGSIYFDELNVSPEGESAGPS